MGNISSSQPASSASPIPINTNAAAKAGPVHSDKDLGVKVVTGGKSGGMWPFDSKPAPKKKTAAPAKKKKTPKNRLEAKTKEALVERAKKLNIKGASGMIKDKLIKAIRSKA